MTNPSKVALTDVICRVSSHLEQLAILVREIENVVCSEISQRSAAKSENIVQLQELDFLRQSLEDLAVLNHVISDRVQGHVDTGIGDRLRIAATKALLEPAENKGPNPDVTPAFGEVDLF